MFGVAPLRRGGGWARWQEPRNWRGGCGDISTVNRRAPLVWLQNDLTTYRLKITRETRAVRRALSLSNSVS